MVRYSTAQLGAAFYGVVLHGNAVRTNDSETR